MKKLLEFSIFIIESCCNLKKKINSNWIDLLIVYERMKTKYKRHDYSKTPTLNYTKHIEKTLGKLPTYKKKSQLSIKRFASPIGGLFPKSSVTCPLCIKRRHLPTSVNCYYFLQLGQLERFGKFFLKMLLLECNF